MTKTVVVSYWGTEGREAYIAEVEFNTSDVNDLARQWWDYCHKEGIIDSVSTKVVKE